jgi:demethylmenaquinone methyltransferase/2-methoxy-6-polyprenyl-1,4-benzoquinol methylase
MRARGTTPPGATSEDEAARWVRGMFSRVACRYDLLNHLLSLNVDRYWRARSAHRLAAYLHRPGAQVLDICCGTGDLLLALEAERGGPVLGSDFCHPMLEGARRKLARRRSDSGVFEADALQLPVPDDSLDLITAAFGFRNLANYEKGLAEMRRVVKPGGAAAILEFSQPPGRVFAGLYNFYSRRVLPAIGAVISGDATAYRYLPESVAKFPAPEGLAQAMRRAGFHKVSFERMTGGIVTLHIGEK